MKDNQNISSQPPQIQSPFKNQMLTYILYPSLFLILLVFAFVFQNCGTKGRNSAPTVAGSPVVPDASPSPASTPQDGDHAIFELYGVDADQIEAVLWNTNLADPSTGTNTGIAVHWNNFQQDDTYLGVFVKLKGQNCISYINNDYLISQLKGLRYILPSVLVGPQPVSIDIKASTADEPHTFKDYFPVGTNVNFSATPLTLTGHQWSLQRLFQNNEQITLSANTEQIFSHTFATIGLYRVGVSASNESSAGSANKDILIGACTGEDKEAMEIILSDASFGNRTPSNILQNPYFNYMRPATPGHKITVLKGIYKYDRTSSPKFIDVNIQNVTSETSCFLMTNLLLNQENMNSGII